MVGSMVKRCSMRLEDGVTDIEHLHLGDGLAVGEGGADFARDLGHPGLSARILQRARGPLVETLDPAGWRT